jgi:hypothetical protein
MEYRVLSPNYGADKKRNGGISPRDAVHRHRQKANRASYKESDFFRRHPVLGLKLKACPDDHGQLWVCISRKLGLVAGLDVVEKVKRHYLRRRMGRGGG